VWIRSPLGLPRAGETTRGAGKLEPMTVDAKASKSQLQVQNLFQLNVFLQSDICEVRNCKHNTMSTVNRGVRIATKTLRSPVIRAPLLRAPSLAVKRANFGRSTRPATVKFSTMTPLQSGAPPPPQAREYDPEIKDIASYIHHTPIESDLAVST
jgi:hypothetical protein